MGLGRQSSYIFPDARHAAFKYQRYEGARGFFRAARLTSCMHSVRPPACRRPPSAGQLSAIFGGVSYW
jgi:hypothetical protein